MWAPFFTISVALIVVVGEIPEERSECHVAVLDYLHFSAKELFIDGPSTCVDFYIKVMKEYEREWDKCEGNKTCRDLKMVEYRGYLTECLYNTTTNPVLMHTFDYWWNKVLKASKFQDFYLRCFECKDDKCYSAVVKDLPSYRPQLDVRLSRQRSRRRMGWI